MLGKQFRPPEPTLLTTALRDAHGVWEPKPRSAAPEKESGPRAAPRGEVRAVAALSIPRRPPCILTAPQTNHALLPPALLPPFPSLPSFLPFSLPLHPLALPSPRGRPAGCRPPSPRPPPAPFSPPPADPPRSGAAEAVTNEPRGAAEPAPRSSVITLPPLSRCSVEAAKQSTGRRRSGPGGGWEFN